VVVVSLVRTNLFPLEDQTGFSEHTSGEFTVRISAPERAVLEMLHLVPEKVAFEEAQLIMENLATLRPELVENLLGLCRSVKVKRLFLYMADKHGYPWLSKIDRNHIDLGKGKRLVVSGGRLDKKYLITIPREGLEPEQ
jgi:hypothetical protein